MTKKKKKILPRQKTIYQKSKSFIKKHDANLRLVLIPTILLVILAILTRVVQVIDVRTKEVQVASESATIPVTSYIFFPHPITPPLTAESAIIVDRDSKSVLYEKNANLRFSMASTAKLMTALVALEHFKSNDILTTLTSNVEGVNVGLQRGDRLYFKDALYALLLPSGNDVAFLIAQNYPGGMNAFVQKMNEKAQQLHLSHTHYADPAGLDDDGNYTTALDLARLAAEITANQIVTDITATKSKIISTVDGSKTFTLTNLNILLGRYGVIGLKTGHTEGAGDVLITSAVVHGRTYILVVMRSQDRFHDTEVLLSYLTAGVATFNPRQNITQ